MLRIRGSPGSVLTLSETSVAGPAKSSVSERIGDLLLIENRVSKDRLRTRLGLWHSALYGPG
jgi:hypothetical protein